MIKYENECVGCPPEMGCMGSACPNSNVMHLICDKCGEEVERLRDYDGEQWCDDCILNEFDIVEEY